MTTPQIKRKVMGRVDVGNNDASSPRGTTAYPRTHTSSLKANGSVRKEGTHRAKVDLSSLSTPSTIPLSAMTSINTHNASAPATRASFLSTPAEDITSPPSERGNPLFSPPRSNVSSPYPVSAPRSPSPSRMMQGTVRTRGQTNSPTIVAQKPRARPVSALYTEGSSSRGARQAPTAHMSTASGVGKSHVRTHSHAPSNTTPASSNGMTSNTGPWTKNAHAVASPSFLSRSRSPSPSLIRQQSTLHRRVSQSSGTSAGKSSTVSTPPSLAPTGSLGRASVSQRPALSAYSSFWSQAQTSREPVSSPSISSAGEALGSPQEIVSENEHVSASPRDHSIAQPLASPHLEMGNEAIEAKTNRKILDLEISNKSLLAINSGLEVLKIKQAREIRDLKRRLREGQSLDGALDEGESWGDLSSDGDDDDGYSSHDDNPLDAELEASHQRCKSLIDDMVQHARQAILARHEYKEKPLGSRVLHPTELDDMLHEDGDEHSTHGFPAEGPDDA